MNGIVRGFAPGVALLAAIAVRPGQPASAQTPAPARPNAGSGGDAVTRAVDAALGPQRSEDAQTTIRRLIRVFYIPDPRIAGKQGLRIVDPDEFLEFRTDPDLMTLPENAPFRGLLTRLLGSAASDPKAKDAVVVQGWVSAPAGSQMVSGAFTVHVSLAPVGSTESPSGKPRLRTKLRWL